MGYEVSLSAPAESDMYAVFERIREAAPDAAEGWLIRLFTQIETLAEMPLRCTVIPETDELGFEARQLLFGRGRGVYRVIFRVLEEKRLVQILRVWHGSRDALTAKDVELGD